MVDPSPELANSRRKYNDARERRHSTFTPLVISLDGLMAPQMDSFIRIIGWAKRNGSLGMVYGRMLGWIRTRIGISARRRFRSGEGLLVFDFKK